MLTARKLSMSCRIRKLIAGVYPALMLLASDAGRPVYERMGYSRISTHTLFVERRFLGEH